MAPPRTALTTAQVSLLSASERRRLVELEAVVERGIDTFIEVAFALVEIRDRRLYRATHVTFESYAQERFRLARRTAYGYIQAAAVLTNVPTSALSLSLLRELAPLPPDAQRQLALLIEGMTVAQARRTIREWRAQQRALQETLPPPPPLPEGTFPTIVADPPWRWSADFGDGLARDHYPSLAVEEIIGLPVVELAAPEAHLYLWVPAAKLVDGLRVVEGWGFTYRTELVWVKPRGLGLGTWFRVGTESILFATRGSLPTRPNVPNWFEAPRGRHSEKPDAFFRLVERASPGPYLELFARRSRTGWTCWGNEVHQAA